MLTGSRTAYELRRAPVHCKQQHRLARCQHSKHIKAGANGDINSLPEELRCCHRPAIVVGQFISQTSMQANISQPARPQLIRKGAHCIASHCQLITAIMFPAATSQRRDTHNRCSNQHQVHGRAHRPSTAGHCRRGSGRWQQRSPGRCAAGHEADRHL